MLRRLNTRVASTAVAAAFAGAPQVPSRRQYQHTNTTSSTKRFLKAAASSPTPSALSSSSSSLAAQIRGYVAQHTPVTRMRVQGRDSVAQRDVPQQWGGGNDSGSGGSQADSLTPYVRQHLTRVYTLLASGCAMAGVGSVLMITTSLAKVIPFWLPMAAGFVPLLWLSFKPPANPTAKLALFYSFTLLEGMAIAPLVLMTSMKGVLVTSLVLTGAVFCGFSAAAYLAPRASLVAWQGPLFGALIGMVALSFLNIFYPTAIAHSLILYGGLALFSVMIAVDTQAMIERARCGAGDHVQDALQMFLNVLNIFIRIAQIMGMSSD